MTDQLKLRLVMVFSTLFIVLNTFFITREQFWFMIIPAALLAVVAAFVALDVLMLIIVFLTPLSLVLQQYDFGVAIAIPTEPLLFGVMVIYLLRSLFVGTFNRLTIFHPITIAILVNLAWIFFTSITSSLPLVSWKFLLSRLWLVIPFYFVCLHLFQNQKNMQRHLWLYIASFSIVIIYTLINHALQGFTEEAAHVAMTPFYNDHTSYGALLAMYLPPLFLFMVDQNYSRNYRLFAIFLFALFITGLIFSFTRAAWLSVGFAIGALFLYWIRIKLIAVIGMILIILGTLFYYQNDISIYLESGRHKHVRDRNLEQRIESITNVTTDASNTERLNRWASAWRMFRERPVLGWGPGTYQFQYAPFQISSEKTQISTNFGERGNAHSEYIGPLAESGVGGLLTYLGIIITALITAARLIYRSNEKSTRWFATALILGLITYFVHGALNNFLDTDKASAPFWGFMAMLVMMDVKERYGPVKRTVD